PVQRYFRAAIAPGTPLALAARLEMQGSIKIGGRWLPFRATEVLAPQRGFVWSARVSGGLFAGSDQYDSGLGAMRWKILGLIPVVQAASIVLAVVAIGRRDFPSHGAWMTRGYAIALGAVLRTDGTLG